MQTPSPEMKIPIHPSSLQCTDAQCGVQFFLQRPLLLVWFVSSARSSCCDDELLQNQPTCWIFTQPIEMLSSYASIPQESRVTREWHLRVTHVRAHPRPLDVHFPPDQPSVTEWVPSPTSQWNETVDSDYFPPLSLSFDIFDSPW